MKHNQYGTPEYRLYRQVYRQAMRYGLTVEQFNSLLESQDFKCVICGQDLRSLKINIDHDPNCCENYANKTTCGKCIKGLICHACNIAVGHIENTIYWGTFEKILQHIGYMQQTIPTTSPDTSTLTKMNRDQHRYYHDGTPVGFD